MEDWKSCPRCTGPLRRAASPGRPLQCDLCGFQQFNNPLPTTLGFPHNGHGKFLLLKRAQEPRAGWWDTVGGFMEAGETPEQCLIREIKEETGLRATIEHLFGAFTSVYGHTGRHTIGLAYLCRITGEPKLSDENDEYGWFNLNEIPELAFTDGNKALAVLRRQ